jgi:hypothetical protein
MRLPLAAEIGKVSFDEQWRRLRFRGLVPGEVPRNCAENCGEHDNILYCHDAETPGSPGAREKSMRPTIRLLIGAVLCMLLATPLSAQQVPNFSGQWQRADANDIGSCWGDVITVTQEGARLQVEYALYEPNDRQPPLRFVYDLEGRETHNDFMMGRGVQMQTSRVMLVGESLES